MEYVVLGRTGLQVNKNGFGALPIQRISKEEAGKLVKKAFENGINYFDTARAYSDSEEKMGAALADVRDQVIISTKTAAQDAKEFWKDLEESLTKDFRQTTLICTSSTIRPFVRSREMDGVI